jgi:hypothetical protein
MKRDNDFGNGGNSSDPGNAYSWIWLVTIVVVFSAIVNAIG